MLTPVQIERLAAIGRDPQVARQVTLHRIYAETDRYLGQLAQNVRSCKGVAEANNFGRWLKFSGVLDLLAANPQPSPLLVDAKELRRKANDLTYDCGQLFAQGRANPNYASCDIAEINQKLAAIAGHVGLEFPPSSTETADADGLTSSLFVIQGGASSPS